MAKYRLFLDSSGVLNTETNQSIPDDSRNEHWKEYQIWLGEGNIPDPAPLPPPRTPELELGSTNVQMIRAIDWMLEYLVGNGTILLADIPTPLKNLYLERKAQREAVGSPQV